MYYSNIEQISKSRWEKLLNNINEKNESYVNLKKNKIHKKVKRNLIESIKILTLGKLPIKDYIQKHENLIPIIEKAYRKPLHELIMREWSQIRKDVEETKTLNNFIQNYPKMAKLIQEIYKKNLKELTSKEWKKLLEKVNNTTEDDLILKNSKITKQKLIEFIKKMVN